MITRSLLLTLVSDHDVYNAQAVSYRIHDSRSAETAGKVLGEFSGTLRCNGYRAYESLQKRSGRFQLAHCWAHVPRSGGVCT